MKIAVASQNRHQITEHAGRCRKFWIYEISHDTVTRKELVTSQKIMANPKQPNEIAAL